MANPTTLCWDCRNSTEKECEWAKYFKPVPGWEAERRKTKYNEDTYIVYKCPRFVRDSWHYGMYRTQEEYDKFLAEKAKREQKKREKEKKNEQSDDHRESD